MSCHCFTKKAGSIIRSHSRHIPLSSLSSAWLTQMRTAATQAMQQKAESPLSSSRPYDFLFRDIEPPPTPRQQPPAPRSSLRFRAGSANRSSTSEVASEHDEDLGPGVPESQPSASYTRRMPSDERWASSAALRDRSRMSPRERQIAYEILREYPELQEKKGVGDLRLKDDGLTMKQDSTEGWDALVGREITEDEANICDDIVAVHLERGATGGPEPDPSAISSETTKTDPFDFFTGKDRELVMEKVSKAERHRQFAEAYREDDIIKELVDDKIRELETLPTALALLQWTYDRVFGGGSAATTAATVPVLPQLGDAHAPEAIPGFFSPEQLQRGEGADALLIDTPLYPYILVYLARRFRHTFSQPHLALHVFELARAQPPHAYFLGCTSELYAEALSIRWYCMVDLVGVRRGMEEMVAFGLELTPAVQEVATAITRTVLQDSLAAEVLASRDWDASSGAEGEKAMGELVRSRARFGAAEKRAAAAIEKMMAQAHRQEREQRRLTRSMGVGPPQHPASALDRYQAL